MEVDADNVSYEWSQHEADKEARDGFGPKEEWVLRWLLKRFDEGEVKLGRFGKFIVMFSNFHGLII